MRINLALSPMFSKDETDGIMLPYLTLNWRDPDWLYEHCDLQGIEILGKV